MKLIKEVYKNGVEIMSMFSMIICFHIPGRGQNLEGEKQFF